MDNKIVENKVREMALPILEKLGYELVDVEYKEQDGSMNLTLFIYKDGGVSLDDCQIVSRALDEPLDALDPTQNMPYNFNVSSPGLDRPLKTIRDFERNLNEELEIDFIAPDGNKKSITGALKDVTNNVLTINQKGKLLKVEFDKIEKALLIIKF
ncbi:MAG: ribosome maturation factor RimP [Spirochaetales bacterium]